MILTPFPIVLSSLEVKPDFKSSVFFEAKRGCAAGRFVLKGNPFCFLSGDER